MQTVISMECEDVEKALAKLGVPLVVLLEAGQAGYLANISRTANDAPSAPGYYQWNECLRSLRENMSAKGFLRSNTGNWPTTVHPQYLLALAVSSANVNTGNPNTQPMTKTAKGPRTVKAVSINASQLWLPGYEPLEAKENSDYPTWFLLYHVDEAKGEIRLELSLPVSMNEDGHVSGWRERIILPSISLSPKMAMPEPDFGPDIKISIFRKA